MARMGRTRRKRRDKWIADPDAESADPFGLHKKHPAPGKKATPAVVKSARERVLDTTELLENILVHLPPKSIFGVQRVAKIFKNVIATSPGIQEKLFLRLKHPEKFWTDRTSTAFNPLFDDHELDPYGGFWQGPIDWDIATRNTRKPLKTDSSFYDVYMCDPPARAVNISLEFEVGPPVGHTCKHTKGTPFTMRELIDSYPLDYIVEGVCNIEESRDWEVRMDTGEAWIMMWLNQTRELEDADGG